MHVAEQLILVLSDLVLRHLVLEGAVDLVRRLLHRRRHLSVVLRLPRLYHRWPMLRLVLVAFRPVLRGAVRVEHLRSLCPRFRARLSLRR